MARKRVRKIICKMIQRKEKNNTNYSVSTHTHTQLLYLKGVDVIKILVNTSNFVEISKILW